MPTWLPGSTPFPMEIPTFFTKEDPHLLAELKVTSFPLGPLPPLGPLGRVTPARVGESSTRAVIVRVTSGVLLDFPSPSRSLLFHSWTLALESWLGLAPLKRFSSFPTTGRRFAKHANPMRVRRVPGLQLCPPVFS